jgi:hypothetical protein
VSSPARDVAGRSPALAVVMTTLLSLALPYTGPITRSNKDGSGAVDMMDGNNT